jgi:hypothetical protein
MRRATKMMDNKLEAPTESKDVGVDIQPPEARV